MIHFTDAQKRQLAMLVGANRVLWMDRHPSAEAEDKAWKIVTENMKAGMPLATSELMKKEWAALKLQYYTMLVHSTMYEETDSVDQHRYFNKMKFLGEKVPYSYRIEVIDTAPITTFTRGVSLPPSSKTIEAVKRKFGVLFSQVEAQAVRDEIARLDVESAIYEILGIGASPTKKQKVAEKPAPSMNPKMSCDILSRLFGKSNDAPAISSNSVLAGLLGDQKNAKPTKLVDTVFDLDEAIRKATIISKHEESKDSPSTSCTSLFDLDAAIKQASLGKKPTLVKEEKLKTTKVTFKPVENTKTPNKISTEDKVIEEHGFNLDEALANAVKDSKQKFVNCKDSPSTSSTNFFDLDAAIKEASLRKEATLVKEELPTTRTVTLVPLKRSIMFKKTPTTEEKVIEVSLSNAVFDLDGELSKFSGKTTTQKEKNLLDSINVLRPMRMVTSEEIKHIGSNKYPGNGVFNLDEELKTVMAESRAIKETATFNVFDLDEAIRSATVQDKEHQESLVTQEEDFQKAIKNGLIILDSQFLNSEPFELDESILYKSFDKEDMDATEYFSDVTQSSISEDKDSETSSVDLSMVSCSTSVYTEEMEALAKGN